MNTFKILLQSFFLIILFLITIENSFCSQAVVPLSINITGKMVITDANSDFAGKDSINKTLRLNSNTIYESSGIRIRTNMKRWRLIAIRESSQNSIRDKNVLFSYSTKAGSKANPHAGRLVNSLDKRASFKKLPNGIPITVLEGNNITSKARDPENENNWFELDMDYGLKHKIRKKIKNKEWVTNITYSLISP